MRAVRLQRRHTIRASKQMAEDANRCLVVGNKPYWCTWWCPLSHFCRASELCHYKRGSVLNKECDSPMLDIAIWAMCPNGNCFQWNNSARKSLHMLCSNFSHSVGTVNQRRHRRLWLWFPPAAAALLMEPKNKCPCIRDFGALYR